MSLGLTKFNKINVLVNRNMNIKDIDENNISLRECIILINMSQLFTFQIKIYL
jgi:GTP cyclohydrolase II